MLDVDWGKTADDYRHFRPGFPAELYERLSRWGIGQAGQRVLDLGTGTGTMARAWAERGCSVVGIDKTPAMLDQARALDAEAGVSIEYAVAPAERTRLPAQGFDGVSAGQCWHWLEGGKAAREVRRVLKPGGWLLIASFDWLPLPENVVDATEKLIEKYNPEWTFSGGTGIHAAWLRDLRSTGFSGIETFSFDLPVRFTHEGWRGRIRASAGVKASLSPDMVSRFDENLRALLLERFAEEPLSIPHCVWAVVCRAP